MRSSMTMLLPRGGPPIYLTGIGGAAGAAVGYGWWMEREADRLEQEELGPSSSRMTTADPPPRPPDVPGSSSSSSSSFPTGAASVAVVRLPRAYDGEALHRYWSLRPISVATRFARIANELGPVMVSYARDFGWTRHRPGRTPEEVRGLQASLARDLREALTNLGPCFVKAGQQLSIRPDLLPPIVLRELQGLCDAVRPIPDDVALDVLREELGLDDLNEVFEDDVRLVASASLGQVYRATLRGTGGREVAVKVQRPGIQRSFSLDLFLLRRLGALVDLFTASFTEQPAFHRALYESFARGSYEELDYEREARSQRRFRDELESRGCRVIVPDVHDDLVTRRVLTTGWIEGIKLADAPKEQIRRLIPVGVELFLTQLLDIGCFHADPHPGNLLVTKEGRLCLLDYGLCTEVDERSRRALTSAMFHLLSRDFETLVRHDAKELGFLPRDLDTTDLQPLLARILTVGLVESGSDLRKRKRKLMEISDELNEVFFRYPFSVPPFFALVTRGLGLLEGIALSGDPEFDIFQASAPFARRRMRNLLGMS